MSNDSTSTLPPLLPSHSQAAIRAGMNACDAAACVMKLADQRCIGAAVGGQGARGEAHHHAVLREGGTGRAEHVAVVAPAEGSREDQEARELRAWHEQTMHECGPHQFCAGSML